MDLTNGLLDYNGDQPNFDFLDLPSDFQSKVGSAEAAELDTSNLNPTLNTTANTSTSSAAEDAWAFLQEQGSQAEQQNTSINTAATGTQQIVEQVFNQQATAGTASIGTIPTQGTQSVMVLPTAATPAVGGVIQIQDGNSVYISRGADNVQQTATQINQQSNVVVAAPQPLLMNNIQLQQLASKPQQIQQPQQQPQQQLIAAAQPQQQIQQQTLQIDNAQQQQVQLPAGIIFQPQNTAQSAQPIQFSTQVPAVTESISSSIAGVVNIQSAGVVNLSVNQLTGNMQARPQAGATIQQASVQPAPNNPLTIQGTLIQTSQGKIIIQQPMGQQLVQSMPHIQLCNANTISTITTPTVTANIQPALSRVQTNAKPIAPVVKQQPTTQMTQQPQLIMQKGPNGQNYLVRTCLPVQQTQSVAAPTQIVMRPQQQQTQQYVLPNTQTQAQVSNKPQTITNSPSPVPTQQVYIQGLIPVQTGQLQLAPNAQQTKIIQQPVQQTQVQQSLPVASSANQYNSEQLNIAQLAATQAGITAQDVSPDSTTNNQSDTNDLFRQIASFNATSTSMLNTSTASVSGVLPVDSTDNFTTSVALAGTATVRTPSRASTPARTPTPSHTPRPPTPSLTPVPAQTPPAALTPSHTPSPMSSHVSVPSPANSMKSLNQLINANIANTSTQGSVQSTSLQNQLQTFNNSIGYTPQGAATVGNAVTAPPNVNAQTLPQQSLPVVQGANQAKPAPQVTQTPAQKLPQKVQLSPSNQQALLKIQRQLKNLLVRPNRTPQENQTMQQLVDIQNKLLVQGRIQAVQSQLAVNTTKTTTVRQTCVVNNTNMMQGTSSSGLQKILEQAANPSVGNSLNLPNPIVSSNPRQVVPQLPSTALASSTDQRFTAANTTTNAAMTQPPILPLSTTYSLPQAATQSFVQSSANTSMTQTSTAIIPTTETVSLSGITMQELNVEIAKLPRAIQERLKKFTPLQQLQLIKSSPLGVRIQRRHMAQIQKGALNATTVSSVVSVSQQQQQQQQGVSSVMSQVSVSNMSSTAPCITTTAASHHVTAQLQSASATSMTRNLIDTRPPTTVALAGTKRITPIIDSKEIKIKKRLIIDQSKVTNPDYKTPFVDCDDAVKRLLPYHVYQCPDLDLESEKKDEEQFEDCSQGLLDKMEEMLCKYRYLLYDEASKKCNSSELVMIERMFIHQEKVQLGEDKKLAEENPDAFVPQPYIEKDPEEVDEEESDDEIEDEDVTIKVEPGIEASINECKVNLGERGAKMSPEAQQDEKEEAATFVDVKQEVKMEVMSPAEVKQEIGSSSSDDDQLQGEEGQGDGRLLDHQDQLHYKVLRNGDEENTQEMCIKQEHHDDGSDAESVAAGAEGNYMLESEESSAVNGLLGSMDNDQYDNKYSETQSAINSILMDGGGGSSGSDGAIVDSNVMLSAASSLSHGYTSTASITSNETSGQLEHGFMEDDIDAAVQSIL